MTKRILNAAMAHLNALCDFGGRLAGTESERQALAYAAGILAGDAGRIRRHAVSYHGWRGDVAGFSIAGSHYPAVALPGSTSLPGGLAALHIVDAGRGTLEDLETVASHLPGRAVMVRHEYMFAPDHVHRCVKSSRARELGAELFVIANSDPWSGAVTGGIEPAMPALGIDYSQAELLSSEARNGRQVDFRLQAGHCEMETETLDLLIPSLDGAETPEIILCAHIDGHAISESAMDNASGAAALLALAEHYRENPAKTLALRILVFSAEEIALCASDHYVAQLAEVARRNISAVVNLDCVAGDPAFGAITNGFDQLAELVASVADRQGVDMVIHNELVRNSDHHAFAVAGIPALRLTAGFGQGQSRLKYVLTERDRRELIDPAEMGSALRLTRGMITELDRTRPTS